jgi:BirA family biotin operon repressor/biotin-[acetyl-CoA-carboxylase] ligase
LQQLQKYNFFTKRCIMAFPKNTFTILDSVDSTNNYAMAKVHAGLATHGDAYLALRQTGGRGQRGKIWHTGNAQNIALSVVMEPLSIPLSQQFKLSAAIALACFDFFKKYADDETRIKWPNDIYWRDRKAAGVLIENVIGHTISRSPTNTNYWKYAIVGIGINVNETIFDKELKDVVSLKQITGKTFDVVELGKELHLQVLKRYDEIITQSFEKTLKEYNQALFRRDKTTKLKKGNVVFDTVIKSVTETGQLYTVDTIDNFFDFGEVEWLPQA